MRYDLILVSIACFAFGFALFFAGGHGSDVATENYFRCTIQQPQNAPAQQGAQACAVQASAMATWSGIAGLGAALVWAGTALLVVGVGLHDRRAEAAPRPPTRAGDDSRGAP